VSTFSCYLILAVVLVTDLQDQEGNDSFRLLFTQSFEI